MGDAVVSFLRENFEDVALVVGVLSLSFGIGAAFGWPFAFVAFGACAIAYGVWITMGGTHELHS